MAMERLNLNDGSKMNLDAIQERSYSALTHAATLSILAMASLALRSAFRRRFQAGRPSWAVTCFYCSHSGTVPQQHMQFAFLCPHCQAFNCFDKDGEFVHMDIYEAEERNRNPTRFRPQLVTNAAHSLRIGAPAVNAANLLCETCLKDQQLWLQIVTERTEEEIESNKHIPYTTLCHLCQPKLKQYWQQHLEWYMAGALASASGPLPAPAPHLETHLIDQVPVPVHEYYLRVTLIATATPWVFALLIILHMLNLFSLAPIPTALAAENWTSIFSYFVKLATALFSTGLFSLIAKCISIQCLVEVAQVFLMTVPCADMRTLAACLLSIIFTALSYRRTLTRGRTILCSYTDAYAANVKADINDLRAKLGLDPVTSSSNSPTASPPSSPPLQPRRLSTPMTPNTAADHITHFTLASPTTPTPRNHAPRTNPAFHVPASVMDPTAIRRPQGFGHNNNFQPAMNARPHAANQFSLPSLSQFAPFAAAKATVGDTQSAWGVAAQSQVAQIQLRNDAVNARQARMAEAAKVQAFRPSAAPGYTRGVVMSDEEVDDSGQEDGAGRGWLRRRRGDSNGMDEWADPNAMDVDPPAAAPPSPVRPPARAGQDAWRGMAAPSAFSGFVNHLRQGSGGGMGASGAGQHQAAAGPQQRRSWIEIEEQVGQLRF